MANSIFVWPGLFTNNGTQIVFTQPVAFPDGSSSAPSITFANETNTGFLRRTTNQLAWSVGGSTDGFFDASGNVNILGNYQMGAGLNAMDVILSRDAANMLALKNGTSPQQFNIYGTTTGSKELQLSHNGTNGVIDTAATSGLLSLAPTNATSVSLGKLVSSYNGIATSGWGLAAVQAAPVPLTGQVAAVASVATYTVGAADGSFEVSANVNVTAATTAAFGVVVTYTDETNTPRSLTLPVAQLAGTFVASITNVTGTGPYEGAVLTIRAKAATAITITTAGTFTSIVYNVSGTIKQVA